MPTLKEQLSEQIKSAMRAGQKDLLTCARNLHAAIRKKEVDERCDVQDTDFLGIVFTAVKRQQETLEQLQKAGRDDLLAKEQFELDFLRAFLPPPLSAEEIRSLIQQAIEEVQAKEVKDISRVMKVLAPRVEYRADPKVVGQYLRESLA